jgi:transcriptional regulator with XRE-family HTH domain
MARPHGYARYRLDGCRCYTCAYARAVYDDRRHRAIAYGTWQPFVEAEPIRQHVRDLQACGLGLRRIAETAGVDRKRLQALLNGRSERGTGPQEKIRPQIAAAILAVEPSLDLLGDKTVIDASGTRRRLQALVALGWSQAKLATRLGWTPGNFGTLMKEPRTVVATARKVRALYDALWDEAPPEADYREKIAASRARNHATKHGWLPPQAWDDDFIDVPDDQLDAELRRRVEAMDDDELKACWNARYSKGDRSPLTVAGAREHNHRRKARAQGVAS